MCRRPRSPTPWLRRLVWALLALLGLVAVAVGVLWLALGSSSVRQKALARASQWAETKFGITFSARDVSLQLSPLHGSLSLEGVEVASVSAGPFLVAEDVRLVASPWSVLHGARRVSHFGVSGVVVDLAGVPPAWLETSDEEADGPPLTLPEVDILAIHGLSVRSLASVYEAEWLEAAQADELAIAGRLQDQRLELGLVEGRITIDTTFTQSLVLGLDGHAARTSDGVMILDGLELASPELALRLNARGSGFEDLSGDYELELDAGTVLRGQASAAKIRASGVFDSARKHATLKLAAPKQSLALVEDLVGPEVWSRYPLGDTSFDLEADLELDNGRSDGEVRWQARRAGVEVLSLEAQPRLSIDAGSLEMPFEAAVYPGRGGTRRLSGVVRASDVRQPAAAVIERGGWAVNVPDLESELSFLRVQWPELVSAELYSALRSGARGALAGDGTVNGRLVDPELQARLDWQPTSASLVEVSFAGFPAQGSGDSTVRLAGLPVDLFLDDVSGLVSGKASASRTGTSSPEIQFELTTSALSWTGEAVLDGASLKGRSRDGILEWEAEGRSPTHGPLVAAGTLSTELPIERGEARLQVLAGPAALSRLDLEARLEGGVLRVATREPAAVFGSSATVEAAVPLKTLAGSIPALADLIREDRVPGVGGPIVAEVEIEPGDWTGAVEDFTGHRLEAAAAGGSLEIALDPMKPALAEGRLTISGLEVATETGRWRAAEALAAHFGNGRVEIEPWRLVSELAQVELNGDLSLWPGWTPDQPLSRLLARGRGVVVAEAPAADHDLPGGLRSLNLPWRVDSGRLEIVDGRLIFAGADPADPEEQGRVEAALPLGGGEGGRVFDLHLEVPSRDWREVLGREGLAEEIDSLIAALEVELTGELDDPLGVSGYIVVPEFRARLGERISELEKPLTISIRDRRALLEEGVLKTAGELFSYRGSIDLAETWSAEEGWEAAIARLELLAHGRLDGAVLNPLLLGGVASGSVEVDVSLSGALENLEGRARVSGEIASVVYREPYLVRLSALDIDLGFSDGTVEVRRGHLKLNEGELDLSGVVLDGEGVTDLRLALRDANFRLDHGLIVKVDSDLRYRSPLPPEVISALAEASERDALVSGRIEVDRGYLTRRINLDVDFLTQLLAPIDLTSTTDDPLEAIELNLQVTTREGVRVKNNIADLLARWDPISVHGSLLRPVIEGVVEVEPGGLVHLYGQTVRLDSASISYPGDLGAEPRLDLETTTSLEDPSIGQLAGNDPFRGEDETDQPVVGLDDVTGDLALYYGEQLAQRLSESLGEIQVSIRPVLVFGEADPTTRLTVSRDFSANVALAASVDLRNAENQTYVMDVRELQRLPGLVGQTFTDDESAYGGSLFQKLEFGGARRLEDTGPRIRRIRVPKLAGVSKRSIKRNLGIAKGDRLAPGSAFAAEVELIEHLRRRGYPSASVRMIASLDEAGERVELDVELEAGPRIDFRFIGEKIPKALRGSVRDLYRVEAPEAETLGEIRAQTVRVLRSRGFLDPQVEVEIVHGESDSNRTIEVRGEGGVRIEPGPPVFMGLGPEDAEIVAQRFAGPVQRVELALGLPEADQRLVSTLVKLGYPDARIVRRWSEQEGKGLNVEVETGARRRIHSIALTGVDNDTERARLTEALAVTAESPARGDLLALSVLQLGEQLEEDGYGRARVSLATEELPGDPFRTAVIFDVVKGERESVGAVDFDGLRASRKSWAGRVTDLEAGDTLGPSTLNSARRNLLSTGVFSSVSSRVEGAEGAGELVVFEVEERERYELAYGARWRSEDGLSAVLDASNRNLLGRGATVAMRALYRDDDQSLRWLLRLPRARKNAGSFEIFASARSRVDAGIVEDILETTLQYSRPFGGHSTVRVYGRYRDTELSEENPDPFLPFEERIKRPLFGTQYIFDNRSSDPIHPLGTFVSVDLSGSDQSFGDFGFARVFSQLRHFRDLPQLAGRRLTWGQSLQLGAAEAFGELFLLPVDRFTAGGEYSVRGYGFESLGPEDERLFASESAVVVLNQELRWKALDRLSPVAFVDVGNVYQDLGDLGSALFASVGFGVRALTPVGLLRLDLAHALDRRSVDPEFKLYFGLGTSF
ncbi:MAG: BamA/TamA family outer membrane protein [bacterium]|nr:BamA/TamA family outer membrane protein [bacterium]